MLTEELRSVEDAVELDAALPGAIVAGKHKFGETTLEIAPAQILAACRYLKTAQQFERLSGGHRGRLVSGRAAFRSRLPSAFDLPQRRGCA